MASDRRLPGTAVVVAALGGALLLAAPATAGSPRVAAAGEARSVGQLSAGTPIAMKLPWTDTLVTTEAPNGAVFYAPAPVIGEMGGVSHKAAAKVVRVIDGTKPAVTAEHTPNPVLAMTADSHDLYVVTTKQALAYSRSTGSLLKSWSLPQTSTNASVVVTPKWLFVSSVAESDFSGFEYSTVQAINLQSEAVHTVSNRASGGPIVGRTDHVFYGVSTGHIVKGTATGAKNSGPRSPKAATNLVGFFGSRLLTYGLTPDGVHSKLFLIDPTSMQSEFSRPISSSFAFDVISTPTGAIYSDSTCYRFFPANKCHSASSGNLGGQVSRLALESGVQSDSVDVHDVDFLLGPKPTAIVATGGAYRLVRIR